MRKNVPAGGLAGLIGALALGLVMQFTPTVVTGGPLPSTVAAARILHLHSAASGWLLVLVYGVVVGAGFGWLTDRRRLSAGRAVIAGIFYSLAGWVILSAGLVPALLGHIPWSSAAIDVARKAAPSTLIGSVIYGLVLGGVLAAIRRRSHRDQPHRRPAARARAAGEPLSASCDGSPRAGAHLQTVTIRVQDVALRQPANDRLSIVDDRQAAGTGSGERGNGRL
jgi:hypothetical protein